LPLLVHTRQLIRVYHTFPVPMHVYDCLHTKPNEWPVFVQDPSKLPPSSNSTSTPNGRPLSRPRSSLMSWTATVIAQIFGGFLFSVFLVSTLEYLN
jgi:hypothetical protein